MFWGWKRRKKMGKDLKDRFDVYNVRKIYINGIPGDMDEEDARAQAVKLVQEHYSDLPMIGSDEERPKDTPSMSVVTEGQRIVLKGSDPPAFEWLIIAAVFTPLEKK